MGIGSNLELHVVESGQRHVSEDEVSWGSHLGETFLRLWYSYVIHFWEWLVEGLNEVLAFFYGWLYAVEFEEAVEFVGGDSFVFEVVHSFEGSMGVEVLVTG